jgi:hypothetical protein
VQCIAITLNDPCQDYIVKPCEMYHACVRLRSFLCRGMSCCTDVVHKDRLQSQLVILLCYRLTPKFMKFHFSNLSEDFQLNFGRFCNQEPAQQSTTSVRQYRSPAAQEQIPMSRVILPAILLATTEVRYLIPECRFGSAPKPYQSPASAPLRRGQYTLSPATAPLRRRQYTLPSSSLLLC